MTDVAPKAAAPKSSTVTVGCKMPHGLELRIFKMENSQEVVMGGGSRDVKVARHVSDVVRINGNAIPFGETPGHPIAGGFALTRGISREFWDTWLEQNKQSPMVMNGLIFAVPTVEDAKSEGRERAKLRSGFEPMAPKGDPRAPKTGSSAISGVEPGDRDAA